MSGSSTGVVTAPTIPQPTAPGQIVGLVLQNTGAGALAPQEVTFGQIFTEGAVPAGGQLFATVNGVQVPVQMDVKTTYPDGSAQSAVLTMEQPALAANSSTGVMLSLAPAGTTPPAAIGLASALANSNYSLSVDLNLHNADGTTTPLSVNVVSAMEAALQNGTATYWLQGSQATQARVDIPVTGSLHLTVDLTAYADGTFSADVQFNNDLAPTTSGDSPTYLPAGTLTYDAAIVQNGSTAYSVSNLTQYQYQDWHQLVYSNGSGPQVNIQHDIAYLEQTGAIANYDLTTGVSTTTLSGEASALSAAGWNTPLAANGVTQYMPMTGGRGDIGPTTAANTIWLMTQNAQAAQYALGQANAAGAVPWHYFNPATGQWLTTNDYANLWTDPGYHTNGTTVLAQPVSTSTGWTADLSHQPNLAYDAYLLTGSRYYLDQMNAQAAWSESGYWPYPRNSGQGIVVTGNQVRGSAWELRQLVDSAYASPNGSAMKAYFTQMVNNNFAYLLQQIPTWTTQQGTAHGYLPENWGSTPEVAPWQQDYFASTVIAAAEMGNQQAVTFLKWESNFLVGRFLPQPGWNQHDGAAYQLIAYNTSTGTFYTSWAQIEQATAAAGLSNGSGWSQSQGDYASLALQSLAGVVTVSDSAIGAGTFTNIDTANALYAYGWLLGSGAPYIDQGTLASVGVQFNIVPRLSDGQLLTANHIVLSQDTTATTIQGTNADQLLYAGSGNDTVIGGSGINILFAGSGNDTLLGGANNDYLYGGSGKDLLYAAGGTNFLEAGTGGTAFVLSTADSGNDTIAGFQVGRDQLDLVAANNVALTTAQIQALIAGATTDSAGNVVLTLSSTHTVTIDGVSLAQLSTSLFGNGSGYGSGAPITGGGGGGGNDPTLNTSGNTVTGGSALLTVTDNAGGNTINGGSGGLVLTATAYGDTVTTTAGATDTLSLTGGDTVTALGNDTVTTLGTIHLQAGAGTLNFTGGAGMATILGGSGGFSLTSGSGGMNFTAGSGSGSITDGSGTDTVTGGSGALTINEGGGTLNFTAGSGNTTINQTTGGGTFIFGKGNTTVNTGSGANVFKLIGGHDGGTDIINNFRFGFDTVQFSGISVQSESWSGSGILLTMNDGTHFDLMFAAN